MTDLVVNHHLQPIPEESSYNSTLDRSQDSVASLDDTHFWSISLDDTPILPAIDGKKVKTFEELVEEALKRDDSPVDLNDSDKPKKPFLRKGSGLVRFAPKFDSPRRERRHCCRKKLEQQFLPEAEQQWQQQQNLVNRKDLLRRNDASRSNSENREEPDLNKRSVITKTTTQKTRRFDAINKDKRNRLSGISIQPKKVQSNNVQNKRPVSGKSTILSRYSNDIGTIQRDQANVVSHEFIPRESKCEKPIKSTINNRKVNFDDDEPRVEALERLLKNIRVKQQELQQRVNELQSDEDDDSWEDDREETDEPIKELRKSKFPLRPKTHKKISRTGTFTLGKAGINKDLDSDHLSAPRVSNYTISLKRKIESLEDRLRELTVKCQQNIEDYKSRESPGVETLSSEKIFTEMSEIKKHLSSLTRKLETLESKLLTKENTTPGIKLNLPSNSSKVLTSPETSLYTQIQQLQTGTHLTLDNGDQIMKTSDTTIVYNYASGVKQITYTVGTRVVEFPSGQIERVCVNGTKTIFYPNGTQRVIRVDGSEETITPDGTIIRVSVDGTEIIDLSNGEREIRTKEFKRREYVDGTIKTIHSDGTEETRFPNGRLRIKDKEGKLIADSLILASINQWSSQVG